MLEAKWRMCIKEEEVISYVKAPNRSCKMRTENQPLDLAYESHLWPWKDSLSGGNG